MNILPGGSVEVVFMPTQGRNSKIGTTAIGLALCLTALGQADDSPRRDTVVEAVGRVMPSVVNIATKTRVQRVRYYYDWWRDNWAPYAQELPPEESASRNFTSVCYFSSNLAAPSLVGREGGEALSSQVIIIQQLSLSLSPRCLSLFSLVLRPSHPKK